MIQVVNAYLSLVDRGLAPTILCKNDRDHGRVFARLDENEKIVLWCLACDYHALLGIKMYNSMYEVVWMHEGMKID